MNTIMTIGGFGTSACTGTRISGARLRVAEPYPQHQLRVVDRVVSPKLVDNSTGVSVSGPRYRT
ncbi:MAG: hypothetical protein ABS81_31890 [Pseudonocardia sp. SCN 72-86]|nr:MAG: hypothetical protein ABS81_31890 [Pseudonocardia sp. SCN 72-86]